MRCTPVSFVWFDERLIEPPALHIFTICQRCFSCACSYIAWPTQRRQIVAATSDVWGCSRERVRTRHHLVTYSLGVVLRYAQFIVFLLILHARRMIKQNRRLLEDFSSISVDLTGVYSGTPFLPPYCVCCRSGAAKNWSVSTSTTRLLIVPNSG